MKQRLGEENNITINMGINIDYTDKEGEAAENIYHWTKSMKINNESEINKFMDRAIEELSGTVERIQQRKSDWRIKTIKTITIADIGYNQLGEVFTLNYLNG